MMLGDETSPLAARFARLAQDCGTQPAMTFRGDERKANQTGDSTFTYDFAKFWRRVERVTAHLQSTWGVQPGAYIVWPLLGPSTLRDSADIPVDVYSSGALLTDDHGTQLGMAALRVVDVRARLLDASSLVDDVALDKYAFVRSAYLQRRLSLVHNGMVPLDDDSNDDEPSYAPYEPYEPEPEVVDPPAAPASAP